MFSSSQSVYPINLHHPREPRNNLPEELCRRLFFRSFLACRKNCHQHTSDAVHTPAVVQTLLMAQTEDKPEQTLQGVPNESMAASNLAFPFADRQYSALAPELVRSCGRLWAHPGYGPLFSFGPPKKLWDRQRVMGPPETYGSAKKSWARQEVMGSPKSYGPAQTLRDRQAPDTPYHLVG